MNVHQQDGPLGDFYNCVNARGSLLAVVIENKNWYPNAHFKIILAYSFQFHFPVSN